MLGQNGLVIWKKANGIDPTPVVPYSERKSISTETTFDQDTIDIHMINDLLVKMVEKIAFSLRKKQKLTSCVTVKIRYAMSSTRKGDLPLPPASCPGRRPSICFPTVFLTM